MKKIRKKNYELEMEKEEEENRVNKDLDEIELYSDKELANIMINAQLLKNMDVNKNLLNMKKDEYNKQYKEELNEEKYLPNYFHLLLHKYNRQKYK